MILNEPVGEVVIYVVGLTYEAWYAGVAAAAGEMVLLKTVVQGILSNSCRETFGNVPLLLGRIYL